MRPGTHPRALPALLSPPEFEDPEQNRRGQLLYRVLLALVPVLAVLTVIGLLSTSPLARATYPTQCVAVFLVLALLRRRLLTPALVILLTSVWGLSTVTIIEEGGVGSAAMGSYGIAVLMAGFFWSFRVALLFALMSSIATAVFIFWPHWVGLPAYAGSSGNRYFAELTAQLLAVSWLLKYALAVISRGAEEKLAADAAALEARLQLAQQRQEAEKFEAIQKLAAGVAHDFRNLLQAIIGELDVLKLEHPHLDLSSAVDSAVRASHLSVQLLAVGKQQQLQVRQLELSTFLKELAPVLRGVAGPNVQLEFRLSDPPTTLVADPVQLERILVNLVANARDAMSGAGELSIETRVERESVCLSVRDHGAGMPPDVKARIFEPFFSTKGDLGTGLGLATVHGIVAQSGGQISVESEVGRGTSIHLAFPRPNGSTTLEAERGARMAARVPRSVGAP